MQISLHTASIVHIYNLYYKYRNKIVRKLKRAKYNRFWSKGTIYLTVLLGAPNAIFWGGNSLQKKVIIIFFGHQIYPSHCRKLF